MKRILTVAALAALAAAPAMAGEIKVGSVAGVTGPIAELVARSSADATSPPNTSTPRAGCWAATPWC